MEELVGFIEIGQDAAAVIEAGQSGVLGVYTPNLQTCMVIAAECQNALVVVHDSGQLAFADISALIGKYGRCRRLTAIYPAGSDIHAERLAGLKRVTKVSGTAFRKELVNMSNFAVTFGVTGAYQVIGNGIAFGFKALPDRATRVSVTELNNFFLKPNSKSLKLDLQFSEGSFNPERAPDKTQEQMLAIMEKQPKFFFNNAALVYAAHQIGILELPEALVELVEEHQLQRFRADVVRPSENPRQAEVFALFMASRQPLAV